jgi:hypothetical protein
MANRGYVNYCVRWDSGAPVWAALRDRIHTALGRRFAKWMLRDWWRHLKNRYGL